MKLKKNAKFGIINLVSLCFVVMVLSIIPSVKVIAESDDSIKKNFFGEVGSLQGILEIWNIDTFESGTFSKESYLLEAANLFQSQNKGTYILIKNLSINELNLELGAGKYPDIFSFGFGMGNVLKKYLIQLNFSNKSFSTEIWDSAITENSQLAVPYLLGAYFLFSTEDYLINANIEPQNVDLTRCINNANYIKKLKKSEKIIESTVYGKNNFISPINSLLGESLSTTNVKEVEDEFFAYQNFISNNISTILLGTHRDLARFENKVKLGQISSFVCNSFSSYTDLVQYMGICNLTSENKKEISMKFIELITSDEMQHKTFDIGMLPVVNVDISPDYSLSDAMLNQIAKFKNKIIVPKLFT